MTVREKLEDALNAKDNNIKAFVWKGAKSEVNGEKEKLVRSCEEEVYNYYQKVNVDYRERLGEQFKDKLAPVINTQDENK